MTADRHAHAHAHTHAHAQSGAHAHAHDHAAADGHAHPARRAPEDRPSMLTASAGRRLALAAAGVVLLWVAVAWALAA